MDDSKRKKRISRISIEQLREYLGQKRKRLHEIDALMARHPMIYDLFMEKGWYQKVTGQLAIWEANPEGNITERAVTVPEYELFRYFEEDSIFAMFIDYFELLEGVINPDRTKYRKWTETKIRFFSQQVSQIYSAIFELFVLGKLMSSRVNVDPYYENIDGRMHIDNRYIYFEIKSLQKSRYDLEGLGAGGTQHDEHQILTALKEKVVQLSPYNDKPIVIFLSLYKLADMTTGEWYAKDFFSTMEGPMLSAVVIYSWFTAGEGKKVLVNTTAANPLSPHEISYLNEYA
jgi:hypothetical protein